MKRAVEEEELDEDENDNQQKEGGGEEEEEQRGEANSVSFVGMNFCGADPLTCRCVLTAFRTAEETYTHGLEEHCGRGEDGMYRCGWLGCEFVTVHRFNMDKHYQRHLLGQWRCDRCSELYVERRHAVGCSHLGQLAQLTAQYSFCEMEGCEDSGKKMAPMELRDHVSAHLTEKDLPSYACQWKGCAKKFEKFPNYLRHINNVHLKLLWKCMSCDARHKSQKEAMACCNKTAVPEPLLWTLGCKCAWNGCNESFKTGDGEMLRAHLKAHLEAEGENPFECRWGHGRCGSVKGVLDSKVKLVRHLEQVHGRLRYKCVTCGKTKALNKKKEIINCDHEVKKQIKPINKKKKKKNED